MQSLNLEFRRRLAESREEILSMAIGEIGRRFDRAFDEVIVPFRPDTEFEGVEFVVPQRGEKKKILEVGMKNVAQYMHDKEKMAEAMDPDRSVNDLMETMKRDFRLSVQPRTFCNM